ncbi:hypothetical protein [Bifidobacterium sp. SO1]|uniref:hypothetical protein n=1 Tax=Bifidobacterium sp. SO1 TaxID=2809029 RepID=UPI001BDC4191|nr:hypothetical protein [Bifidobacterium sp. SO1]MBT1162886.1 hypothetical protein [Bifidobacterium sp. SO1]
MPKRRILLLLTEGTSDANALAAPLQKLLNEVRLGDFQIRCDVTTARLFPNNFKGKHHFIPGWNVGLTVDGLVDEYLAQQGREATSLGWVAHLTDLDGAFIDDSLVTQDTSLDRRIYSPTGIISPNRLATLTELEEKRRCIDILVKKTNFQRSIKKNKKTEEAWKAPYRLFYMSRNLEQALHEITENLSDEEKDDLAAGFAEDNADPAVFQANLEQAAKRHGDMPSWEASWKYAKDMSSRHSLESGSNLKWITDFVSNYGAKVVRTTKD